MPPFLRTCLVVYWLALAFWLAALVTGGIAAMAVFGRLPSIGMTLDAYAAFPAAEHGRIAAGIVMSEIFFATDLVQFVVAPLALIAVALQVSVFGMPPARPSNLTRLGCIVIAAGLLAIYATTSAPAIYRNMRGFQEAARSGDLDAAARHAGIVQEHHGTARAILQADLLLILVAIGASAIALGPGPGRRAGGGLQTPELARTL